MGRVESEIQRDIIGYLRGLDATYVLNVGGGASTAKGTPDLIVCHDGLFVSIEVKRPDGSYGVTKPQEIRMRQIRAANGIALVATSVSEVATALAALRERDAMNDESIVYELDPDVDINPDDLDPADTPRERVMYEVVTEDDVEVDDPDGD